ncbi:MAG: flagellar assembly protein FliW [Bacillota bacterium]
MAVEAREQQTEPLHNIDVTFPHGLPGFEDHREFRLEAPPELAPFRILRSRDQEEVAFILVDPRLVVDGYSVAELNGQEAEWLVGAVVTLADQPEKITVNLQAPVVIDRRRWQGRQLIMPESPYSIRHPLLAG